MIKDHIDNRLAPIAGLIRELDGDAMRFADVYRRKTYKRGQVVIFRGGLWLCLGCTDTSAATGDWNCGENRRLWSRALTGRKRATMKPDPTITEAVAMLDEILAQSISDLEALLIQKGATDEELAHELEIARAVSALHRATRCSPSCCRGCNAVARRCNSASRLTRDPHKWPYVR